MTPRPTPRLAILPRRTTLCVSILICLAILRAPAHASIALVDGEPFGAFGTMLPVGHASIYLDHLCVETPTRLRPCGPGEFGAVISRYHDLRAPGLDWIAFPATVFFYGEPDPALAPTQITSAQRAALRELYRQQYLAAYIPGRITRHGRLKPPPYGDWEEGIGAAFDRSLYLWSIDTTPAQDAQLLATINALPNRRAYNLFRHNCADFAASLLAVVLPQRPRRNLWADFNIMTPKNLARDLESLGRQYPDLHLRVFRVPQIPGTIRRSRPLRGNSEMFLSQKRYLAAMLVLCPPLLAADAVVYTTHGRWRPPADALPLTPSTLTATLAPQPPDPDTVPTPTTSTIAAQQQ